MVMSTRELIFKAVVVVLAVGTIGFSLKFPTLFEKASFNMTVGEVYSVCYGLRDQTIITLNDARHSSITLQGNFIDTIHPGTQYTILHSEGWWLPNWPNLGDSIWLFTTAVLLLIVGLRTKVDET